ncbi:MAG TPA: hypothetical protein VMS64_38330 [Candidatus Methylomirabilis sp.]|nr:hypothetical protein [Candidatus Methylomirabilis sp.]
MIILYGVPLVFHQLPNNFDTLSESFEPIKTLKFAHSKGRAFHKWGPMPSFIYAPLYAPLMAYWSLHGDLRQISTTYPYGFRRPFEQQGALIALARSAGVLIAVVCIGLYGRALTRMTGSRLAVFLALLLCVTTSPRLVFDFVSTKPDGLMLAFLAGSMAVYTDVIGRGLTRRRGFLLSLLAVASMSCKELTAALYLPLYAGLGLWGAARPVRERDERRRFLIDYVFTIGVGVIAYLLINVVYAPATWRLRVAEWLLGPGKDPAVWAPPNYSTPAYLRDALADVLGNLGIGGVAIVAITLLITLVAPVRNRLLLWVPAAGFAMIVIVSAGYLPDYFFSPLNVAVALPVAVALAYAGAAWAPRASSAVRGAALAFVSVLCLINAWTATSVWARASLSVPSLVERYCRLHVSPRELIHTANLWVRQPGAHRLSYLGFDVDDRPLGEIMAHPPRMPDVILISRPSLAWLEDFKLRPARDAMMGATGYRYKDFPGFGALGYRIVAVVEPRVPRLLDFPWVRDLCTRPGSSLLVFRRVP